MRLRFLLDENESARLKQALLRLNPLIDVLRVGEPGAPGLGATDPDILRYLEVSQRMLITSNRASMPAHIEAHWPAGGQLWGVLWIRPMTRVGQIARELAFVWEASQAEEWIDQLDWIPF